MCFQRLSQTTSFSACKYPGPKWVSCFTFIISCSCVTFVQGSQYSEEGLLTIGKDISPTRLGKLNQLLPHKLGQPMNWQHEAAVATPGSISKFAPSPVIPHRHRQPPTLLLRHAMSITPPIHPCRNKYSIQLTFRITFAKTLLVFHWT